MTCPKSVWVKGLYLGVMLCVVSLYSCKPAGSGGVGVGNAGGRGCNSMLAGGAAQVASVDYRAFADKGYGVEMEWGEGRSCTGSVVLENAGSKVVRAHIQTSYHCARKMLMERKPDAKDFRLAVGVGQNSVCKGDDGKQLYFVSLPFELKSSSYLHKLANKIEALKSRNLDPISRDRIWLENSYVHSDIDTKVYENFERESRLPLSDVEQIKEFDRVHDKHGCSTDPLLKGILPSMPEAYKNFRRFLMEPKVASPCFLYSDVVFFSVDIDEAAFYDPMIPKCLQGAELLQNSGAPLKLRMGTHPRDKSSWAESLMDFHDRALGWGLEAEALREPTQEMRDVHQKLSHSFDSLVKRNVREMVKTFNHGRKPTTFDRESEYGQEQQEQQQEEKSLSDAITTRIYAFITDTPKELKLHTFVYEKDKDGSLDKGTYVFRTLNLAFDPKKLYLPAKDSGVWDLIGNISSITWRAWGFFIVLTNTVTDKGSSGSFIVSGGEVLAALYSQDNEEHSTSGHPILAREKDAGDYVPNVAVAKPPDDKRTGGIREDQGGSASQPVVKDATKEETGSTSYNLPPSSDNQRDANHGEQQRGGLRKGSRVYDTTGEPINRSMNVQCQQT